MGRLANTGYWDVYKSKGTGRGKQKTREMALISECTVVFRTANLRNTIEWPINGVPSKLKLLVDGQPCSLVEFRSMINVSESTVHRLKRAYKSFNYLDYKVRFVAV